MPYALDTSAAVPLLVQSHSAHEAVRALVRGHHRVLTAHSLVETYSVLTRLPGDARLTGPDAARLLSTNFGAAIVPSSETQQAIPKRLSALGIAGGAVYDALVGLAAAEAGLRLVTRDARALGTYSAVGADVLVGA